MALNLKNRLKKSIIVACICLITANVLADMFFFQVRDLAIIPVITIRILLIAFDLGAIILFCG